MKQYRIRKNNITRNFYAEVKGWFFWNCLDYHGEVLGWGLQSGSFDIDQARDRIKLHEKNIRKKNEPRYTVVERHPQDLPCF